MMLCAALHREGSYLCIPVDLFAWALRREAGHCRAMSDYEHLRHACDCVARARVLGLL